MSPNWRLAALLHDAPEYVIGDMISPFKAALGLDYRTFEDRLERAIHIRFGLPAHAAGPVRALIKIADRASAFFEATQLAGFEHARGPRRSSALRPPAIAWRSSRSAPGDAQARYLQRFHVLSEAAGFGGAASAFDTRMTTPVVIGLSAVIIALRDGEGCVLTVRPRDSLTDRASTLEGLPFGPFDPLDHRTFELALREFVTRQTRFELGYVEQLYTFGDKGRDAPRADIGAGAARVISVGYLALAPDGGRDPGRPTPPGRPGRATFPWEDWREGRPELIDQAIAPALAQWAAQSEARRGRARHLFALDGSAWNEERVLDRYELLYEAGLAPEAARDRARALGGAPAEPRRPDPGARRADDLRPPPHPGHRSGPAAGQAEIPPGGVRTDGRGVHPLGACSARWRRSPASPCTSRTSAAWSNAPAWWRAWAAWTPTPADGPPNCSGFAANCWPNGRPRACPCRCCASEDRADSRLRNRGGWCQSPRTIRNDREVLELSQAVIAATGLYVPPQSVSNAELVATFNAYVELFNSEHADADRRRRR